MADFKTLNVNNGTWDVKDETARNDISTINNTIDNTITPSLATLNSNKASHTDLSNAINALDYADAAESGKYVSEVSETDGVISVTRASLPTKLSDFTDDVVAGNYLPLTGGTVDGDIELANSGQYFISPTGFIVDFSGNNATHYGKTFIHSSTYGTDSMNIEWPQLNANETVTVSFPPTTGTVALTSDITTDIAAAIAALDYSDTAVTGQYVSEVSETDGVISVTRASLPTKLSDFTDDVVAGNYQPICSTSSAATTSYELAANAVTMACEMSVLKGFNIIRVGVMVPNDVSDTDFTAIFSPTSGSSTIATGTTQHQYIGNPIGSYKTVLDFVYTGVFNSDMTFYCNIMHNNASNISVATFARIVNIPM